MNECCEAKISFVLLLNSFIAYLPCQLHANVCAAGRRIESNFHFLKKPTFPQSTGLYTKIKSTKTILLFDSQIENRIS